MCLLEVSGLVQEVSDSSYRITSVGYDYLDAIRSDTIWQRTKTGAAEVGGMSLGMMRDLALAYLKEEVSAKLGVAL